MASLISYGNEFYGKISKVECRDFEEEKIDKAQEYVDQLSSH